MKGALEPEISDIHETDMEATGAVNTDGNIRRVNSSPSTRVSFAPARRCLLFIRPRPSLIYGSVGSVWLPHLRKTEVCLP